MNSYDRIARVIRYLDTHHTQQPDLAALAAQAGLSPFHFHRLFSAWAGITPKDFLQYLTLAHATALLRAGDSVLDAALAAGLSGAGRLHDLCVSLDSATPGEVKSGGDGWIVEYGLADTPFGICLIGRVPRGICHLSFVDGEPDADPRVRLRAQWPRARLRRRDSMAAQLAGRIFDRGVPSATGEPLRAVVKGTPFQLRVWRALVQIPPGTAVSYGRLAQAVGHPGAARAVGTALGRNPLAYLIPCHRVIRETGVIGIYRWGRARKRAMLAWDSASPVPAVDRGAGPGVKVSS